MGVSPGGAALVWVFDFSDSESELVKLRAEAARARGDFSALVSLIEAAPMPMWFRAPDGRLRLVNSAYVAAVAGKNAESVVEAGMELGLEWGGNWTTIVDQPHFQLRPAWAQDLPEREMLASLRERLASGQPVFA